MSEVAETVKEGAAALPAISRYFPVVVALGGLLGVGLLVWRDEVRADAQIQVLQGMARELGDLRHDFEVAGFSARRPAARDTR